MLILLRIVSTFGTCVPIECQDTYDPYSRCIEVTETIKVSSCPPGMYCPSYSDITNYNQTLNFLDTYCEYLPLNAPKDLCSDPSYQGSQIPGDSCCINSNCNSNICSNLICQGLPAGANCTSTSICSPGYYCNSNSTCVSALPSGSKCTSDLECMIGYGCNMKFCTQLWSIGYSNKAQDAKFCVSNYLFGEACDMIQVRINGTFDLDSPFQCNFEDTCTYVSASYKLVFDQSACLCSGNANLTYGYCGSYINNVQGMFENIYSAMVYSTSRCSGEKAHSSNPYDLWQCGSISSTAYQNYLVNQERNKFWALYQGQALEGCAESITLFQVSGVSTILLSLLGILLY